MSCKSLSQFELYGPHQLVEKLVELVAILKNVSRQISASHITEVNL